MYGRMTRIQTSPDTLEKGIAFFKETVVPGAKPTPGAAGASEPEGLPRPDHERRPDYRPEHGVDRLGYAGRPRGQRIQGQQPAPGRRGCRRSCGRQGRDVRVSVRRGKAAEPGLTPILLRGGR